MKPAIGAAVLLALWTTASTFAKATVDTPVTAQAEKPPAPKELALVQKIRARIEEQSGKAAAAAYKVTIPNTTVTYGMAPVPAGEFLMGSAGPGDEQPQHKVRLDAFWMQTHEVTWDSYLMFMFADQAKETGHPDAIVDALSRPTGPHLEMSFGRGNNGFPAISMTQHAANKYAEWLSAKTGEYYRLPTEAEWEYACRAGSPAGVPAARLGDYAWFLTNSPMGNFSGGTYHPIGTKTPNAWGLYDMLGNVMEWTLDQYKPYANAEAENPWVRSTTSYPHAVRGGSWHDEAAKVSCTVRVASEARWKMLDPQLPKSVWYMTNAQWLGFRLIRPAKLPSAEDMYRAWNNGVEIDPYSNDMIRCLPGLCLAFAVLANFFQSPEPAALHRYEAVEPHMGTLVRVTVYTPDEQTAKAAFRAAFDRIRDLDDILSDYKPDSELNRITKTAVTRAMPVSEDLFTVLRASQELAVATGGAFDITQAPVIRLWREARRTGRAPDAAALRDAATRAGFRKLHLDAEQRTVRFDMTGMLLDVGGIGKGYAASEAIEALDARGVRSALVAVSGDLAFSDAPPGERGWRIGVHDDPAVVDVPGVLELTNGAVSTAGSSQQHVDINGRRYSHIIDPSSGMGLVDDITVTVVAPHGLEADGLDTAASVLGAERGLALIESHPNAAALIIEHTSTGTRVRQSSTFVKLTARRRD